VEPRLWRRRLWQRYGATVAVLPFALTVLAMLGVYDGVIQRRIAAQGAQATTPATPDGYASTPLAPTNRDGASRTRELMAKFERGLPPHDEVGETLASIVKYAEARHLVLTHGEYRHQPDDVGPFERNEMLLPVSGDASAVQGFVADVLQAQPYLALEHLGVQRSLTSPGAVDVQLRWVLLTRRLAGGQSAAIVPTATASEVQP
jgi:hypothetical protein